MGQGVTKTPIYFVDSLRSRMNIVGGIKTVVSEVVNQNFVSVEIGRSAQRVNGQVERCLRKLIAMEAISFMANGANGEDEFFFRIAVKNGLPHVNDFLDAEPTSDEFARRKLMAVANNKAVALENIGSSESNDNNIGSAECLGSRLHGAVDATKGLFGSWSRKAGMVVERTPKTLNFNQIPELITPAGLNVGYSVRNRQRIIQVARRVDNRLETIGNQPVANFGCEAGAKQQYV